MMMVRLMMLLMVHLIWWWVLERRRGVRGGCCKLFQQLLLLVLLLLLWDNRGRHRWNELPASTPCVLLLVLLVELPLLLLHVLKKVQVVHGGRHATLNYVGHPASNRTWAAIDG